MTTKEFKQICNSTVAVAVAVAILEQFRTGYLQNYDLQFLNLTYACPRLPFTLIFSYKISTHHKEWGEPSPKEKNTKKIKEKQDLRERLRAAQEENCRDQLGVQSFLFLSCFLVFYLFMGMCFMAETLFFIFLLQIMN